MKNQRPTNNILTSVIPLSILFVLIQAVSLIGFFHFSFKSVEDYSIRKNLQSCINMMQNEMDRISGLVYEWSAWDATAIFINGDDPNYPETNAIVDSMEQQEINVFCILDSHGKAIWTRCVKSRNDKRQEISLSLFTPKNLKDNPALWEHNNANSCITGYYSTEEGILMLCSRPVIYSSQEKLIQGAVIIGQFVTDDLIASITRQQCRDFDWWNLRTAYTRNVVKQYLSYITEENPIYIDITPDTALAYTILPDVNGNDAILVRLTMTNDIASFKHGWLLKCLAVYAIEGLIFIIYLAAFTNKHCIACQKQIKEELLAIDSVPADFKIVKKPETQYVFEDLPI